MNRRSLLRPPVLFLALALIVNTLSPAQPRSAELPAAEADGSVLPFPPTPSASVAGPTLQESTMKWRKEPERLKPGAPNVLIVLIDDVGFGLPDTFGGEVRTPTLSRLRDQGISYNAFHTTSICSPTRGTFDGPESPPGRQRHDRRAGFGFRRLHGHHPQDVGDHRGDVAPCPQFHHVNDIVPTLYEVIGIKQPKVVSGFKQDPIDGVSLAYTFADAQAPRPEDDAVLRKQRQPRHLPRWLVCLCIRAVRSLGYTEHGGAFERLGREQGRVGIILRGERFLPGS